MHNHLSYVAALPDNKLATEYARCIPSWMRKTVPLTEDLSN